MPDRDLTNEEYDFINRALDIVALSDPGGPTAEEDRMYCSLLDMGCTEQSKSLAMHQRSEKPTWTVSGCETAKGLSLKFLQRLDSASTITSAGAPP